jgi:glycosyltransferase involved in cell wall biosynthesis
MPADLLSVVMPTRNRPDRLLRAAESVLSQDFGEIELVVVDDASTDDTAEALDRLAEDERVRVVHNAESLGPGGSRNRGIAAARGNLLGFCDDDDTWLPGAAKAILDALADDPEVGVFTGWHQVVHDPGGRTALFRGPCRYGAGELAWFDFVGVPFGIIRRDLFEPDLAVDPQLPSCEDWDLWLRCARVRPIRTLPRVVYAYHQHGGVRVTREGSAFFVGRQRFIEKHAESMSASCRLYHELVSAQLTQGRKGAAEQLGAEWRTPVSAAIAAAVLGASAAASAIGTRRHDPGLPARTVARMLGVERATR